MQVFLIGFMGSGKSHTGRRLADMLNRPFVDLDDQIAGKAGKSIPDLFAEKGQAYFRELEKECLRSLSSPPLRVIACGGGTPCYFNNMDWMNKEGLTIYLRASTSILAQRLVKAKDKRPLLSGIEADRLPEFIIDKVTERSPYYMQANVVYDQKMVEEDVAQALYDQFSNIIGH